MLFRKEAVENSLGRLSGEILLTPKLSQTVITIFIVVWVAIAFVWLANSNYSRKETVLGWLESTEGITRIYNKNMDGIVTEIYVRDEQKIIKGDKLFKMDTSTRLNNGSKLEESLLTEYINQKLLLDEQLKRSQYNFPSHKDQLQHQISSAKAELNQLLNQIDTLQQRELIVTDEVNRYTALFDKKVITKMEVNKATKELLSIKSEQQSVSRLIEQQKERINQYEVELELAPSKYEDDISLINADIYRLNQQILQIKSRKEEIFYAPVSGVISNIQVDSGQKPSMSVPLLSITPSNIKLIVHLLVPIRSAGFLAIGQTLNVRYDAFPYQKFGIYNATITKISNAIFLPNELVNTPFELQEAFYRLEAKLDNDSVNAYGRIIPLKAGMTLSADINLSKRSLLEWLLEPVYSLKGQFK